MKSSLQLTVFLLFSVLLPAQPGRPELSSDKEAKPEKYTLSGFRHGVSFFPKVKFPGVQYDSTDTLSFDVYHSLDVIYSWLRRWEKEYPDLIDLYEIGKSFEGRPILQMTVTNKKLGKDTDKPAAFFEGGRHSGEITGSECVMWMIQYLLTNYGKDTDVTHLLDTKVIYLKPVNNPDGHNLYLNTSQSNRSTVRPEDNDGDALLDEDAPEDLDNDGLILTMRWKDEKKGNLIPDPKDSTGRIMKRVPAGQGIYLSSSEGIDNDGDGRINEDGIGGLDLPRNYPENWRPMPGRDLTGRGWTQGGAGEYPLSEPETRAVFPFLLEHPNVRALQTMDTTVPMLLHGPSTSRMGESMFPEDMKIYQFLDEQGKRITGYPNAGDTYWDYANLGRGDRDMRAMAAEMGVGMPREPQGRPLFGHSPDFGYLYYGAVWSLDGLRKR